MQKTCNDSEFMVVEYDLCGVVELSNYVGDKDYLKEEGLRPVVLQAEYIRTDEYGDYFLVEYVFRKQKKSKELQPIDD